MAGTATITALDVSVEDGAIRPALQVVPHVESDHVWAIRSSRLTKTYGARRAVDAGLAGVDEPIHVPRTRAP